MRCSEIIAGLNRLAPESYAEEWDNPGLLCGCRHREVTKVMLALDASDEVVEQAAAAGVQMLLTHHPLIFKPIKKITDEDFLGRRLIKLIKADIAYYAMHTNYDAAPGCMADLAAGCLELSKVVPLAAAGERDGVPYGIGKIGLLPRPMTVSEVAEFVKERFGLPSVTVYGLPQVTEAVSRVAVSPGAGGSMVRPALESGADILITGDIGHHTGIDAAACHMAVIDAGHFGLEHIFMDHMEQYLNAEFGAALTLIKAVEPFPAKVI